jgi:hypothetical protein
MSFQATEWARGLPLPTISAKFTLMMIGSYAGTDGVAFPSLATLAEDTLQSVDTVRRRIRELEDLGLLVRLWRWTTPDGHVLVTEASEADRPAGARQSSAELRLQLKVTSEQLLAAMAKRTGGENEAPDQGDGAEAVDSGGVADCYPPPPSAQVLPSPSQGPATPGVAPSCNPLKRLSNSSGEAPPSSPPENGGTRESNFDPELRKTGRKRLEAVMPIWPEPITDAKRAVVVLGALTEDEFADCLVGVKGFAAFAKERADRGKPRVIKDFHNWARGKQWVGFVAKGAEIERGDQRVHVAEDSPEGRAWATLHKIARITPKSFGGKFLLAGPMSRQLLAFAEAPPIAEWHFIEEADRQQVGAWNGFLGRALDGKTMARPELVSERNWRGIEKLIGRGFVAPWAWPPRVDGTLTTGPPSEEGA